MFPESVRRDIIEWAERIVKTMAWKPEMFVMFAEEVFNIGVETLLHHKQVARSHREILHPDVLIFKPMLQREEKKKK